jgi:hypothetical protein
MGGSIRGRGSKMFLSMALRTGYRALNTYLSNDEGVRAMRIVPLHEGFRGMLLVPFNAWG